MKTILIVMKNVAIFLLFVGDAAAAAVAAATEEGGNNNNNNNHQKQEEHDPYDVAWATRSTTLTYNQDRYNDFIAKCQEAAAATTPNTNTNTNHGNEDICIAAEQDRMKRNRMQPSAMRNYTKMGFHVMPIPNTLYDQLLTFWNKHWSTKNNHQSNNDSTTTTTTTATADSKSSSIEIEWKGAVTHAYQNSWEAPTSMIQMQNYDMKLRSKVWDTMRIILEEWTHERLAPCAFWGIRIYPRHAILAPHVDASPRIISAILNIDQRVDSTGSSTTPMEQTTLDHDTNTPPMENTKNKDWPLEVWGHDGKAYNITLHPGEMALYESHSIIHGRPYPLEGDYYANIFVHFEPLGIPWNMSVEDHIIAKQQQQEKETSSTTSTTNPTTTTLPPYILPDHDEMVQTWKRLNPNGWTLYHNELASYIIRGDVRAVENILLTQPQMFHTKLPNQGNDLYAIQLAERYERTKIVRLLKNTKSYPSHIVMEDKNQDESSSKEEL